MEEPDGLGPFPSVMLNYCKRARTGDESHLALKVIFILILLAAPGGSLCHCYIDKEFEVKKSNFPKSNVADIGLKPGSW